MPGRRPTRPVSQTGISPQNDSATMLDGLVKAGKITSGQAAQYKVWEAAKPNVPAGTDRFKAWMSSRPNLPGVPSLVEPLAVPGQRPAASAVRPAVGMTRPVVPPARPVAAAPTPAAPPRPNIVEIAEQLYKEGKVTRGQFERYKEWEATRPTLDAGRAKFDAWTKSRPEIPHLDEYLKEKGLTFVPPPPRASIDPLH
ncbi:MAG: hypothetical protein M0R22_12325 [Dehalococcoidia bacterium]|nr:hypothetical protein [Dehalococcoidia bacterium]